MDLYDLLAWDWLLSSCTESEDEEQCDCTPAERGLSSRVQFGSVIVLTPLTHPTAAALSVKRTGDGFVVKGGELDSS